MQLPCRPTELLQIANVQHKAISSFCSLRPEPCSRPLRIERLAALAPATASRQQSSQGVSTSGNGPAHQPEGRGQRQPVQKPSLAQGLPSPQPETSKYVTLYYASGWLTPVLHCSLGGSAWQQVQLQPVASSSGHWLHTRLQLPDHPASGVPALEFVIQGDQDAWDKPPTGSNYRIQQAGSYRLQDGAVALVQPRPCLVVSDLDDTMVGDDAASSAFRRWWEAEGVVAGGRLAYNTGRALDSFIRLTEEKGTNLAQPDVLISAVGTVIYQRSPAAPGGWEKDAGFAACLDADWNLDVVREAAYRALVQVGKDHMHFRPPDEQNDHKVTCGVRTEAVDRVVQSIQQAADAAGVQAKLILSGKGDWRFLDIVAAGAGKLAALEYVREQLGYSHRQTVACGDSGNDKDMLSGQNLAIVVGNAQPDLVAWLAEQKEETANGHEQPRLFSAEQHMALGILEGLEQFGFK